MAKLVAVTGATGFVGPHLVRALAARGYRLRLLVRRWSPLPSLAGIELELVLGDLEDRAALGALCAGADAVIHAAGAIKARTTADFMRANRDGTANLSTAAGAARLILLSSLVAREPDLSPYAASKRAAERAVADRSGPWLAVRAPAVYGPGDRETLAYFAGVARGLALAPRADGARVSMIHVEDLAQALAGCVAVELDREICEIDDGKAEGYGYPDLAQAAEAALGRTARTLRVPRPAMAALGRINAGLNRLGAPVQILTHGKVREIFHPDWVVRDRKLAAVLAFSPRYGLMEGFRDTVLWYRRNNWLRQTRNTV
ncbi:MAG: NAD-dependent epimerase/dehydratase family protein [Alphaproteobacteria bacterium]|nr:NAD-dependent epimerase/dehydratase family protein [Alphaproteobacteria bacterium]